MTNKKHATQIEERVGEREDYRGKVLPLMRRVEVYYYKGRGAVLSVQTFSKDGPFESTNLLGDNNSSDAFVPMARPKPTVLRALGGKLEEHRSTILATLGVDYHEVEKDEAKDRLLRVVKILRDRAADQPAAVAAE